MIDVYGIYADELEAITSSLSESLAITFQSRHSLYQGGDYAHGKTSQVMLTLRHNQDLLWQPSDPETERFFMPAFPSYKIILLVEGREGLTEMRIKLAALAPVVTFLQSQIAL